MATALKVEGEKYVLLEHVSWEAYEALLRCWADLPRRMTYDRGRLEIMTPLRLHEHSRSLLGRLIEAYTLERDIPAVGGGSTTFRKQVMERGLEPDECYWIQSLPRLGPAEEQDQETDPPPDLAVEVDITSSSLDRMGIYADLCVPEVWRFDGETFTINLLSEGEYHASEAGLALPALTVEVVSRFLAMRSQLDDTALVRCFLRWVRAEDEGDSLTPKPKRRRKK